MNFKLWLALGSLLLVTGTGSAAELKICINEAAPPYSWRANGGGGFDVAVAKALADKLGRPLHIRWFESKLDEDSSAALEANALLSDGVCDLVAGYPLTEDSLARPGTPTAKLPDFDGFTPADRKRRISLGALMATRPYHFAPFAVILGPNAGAKSVMKLADLQGLSIGVEGGTLADTILMSWSGGKLIDSISHFVPGRDEMWPAFEHGDFAATLTPLHRFDAYRARHPQTSLRDSGYRYPHGFNIGFVGLADQPALIAAADSALSELQSSGRISEMARAADMTFAPPREPEVAKALRLRDLQAP